MKEAASTFEASVNLYQTTRRYNQKTAIFRVKLLMVVFGMMVSPDFVVNRITAGI
jgi:type III secretory pathway component EscS